jgi:hypothetical protein
VGCPRPMAGFAGVIVGRAVGDALFGVGGHHIGFEMVLVAPLADFRPHDAIASAGLPGR